ncbi:MAG: hypothetical protein ACRDNO_07525 [Trebonia sp.]
MEGLADLQSWWLGCCRCLLAPTVSGRSKEALEGSLIDELQRQEAAARAEEQELRGRIAELPERLAGVEELSRRHGAGHPVRLAPPSRRMTESR